MEGAREVFPVAVRDLKTQTQFVIQGTVRHFLAGFIVERRSRGLARRTVTYYESELRLFCEFLDGQGVEMLEDVTTEVVRQYLLVLGNTRNPGGIHAAFRAIRAFFLWYEDEFEPENWKNPVRKVRGPKVPKNPLEGVHVDTIRAMIEHCGTETARRDRLILRVLYDTGVRANELLALNVEDIDLVTGSVKVRMGKGKKDRTVFLGAKSRKELRAFLKERQEPFGALFTTDDGEDRLQYGGLVRMIQRRAKDAKVPAPGVHDFRRAFAVTMLRNGCDLARLAELMGHSSLEVLRRYLHLVTEDLREIHALAGPGDKL
jgi:integrase/recombinase XerD